jgi:hypothetical protein
MILYPLPAIVGIIVWAFIFYTVDMEFKLGALGVMSLGALVFLGQSYRAKQWPFAADSANV